MAGPSADPITQGHEGYVSALFRCETTDAKYLCVYDAISKLKCNTDCDIGGTYSGASPEFWFYCTTTACHGDTHLLNLFVCHRKTGHFSIDISNSSSYTLKSIKNEDESHLVLPKTFETFKFKTFKEDERHFIKTFCFTKDNVPFDGILLIPIKITINPKFAITSNILKAIKLAHDFSGLLMKQGTTDFVLESASTKKFPTHKIILAAHSPILRQMIKNTELTTLFIDISDNDMELLLEFIYTGTIKDLLNQDCAKLLTIADKFQLKPLFMLTQYVIGDQIKVDNAVELAVVAKQYKLEELKTKVFDFIIKNPEVMNTKAWNDLEDAELTKSLFKYMHAMKD